MWRNILGGYAFVMAVLCAMVVIIALAARLLDRIDRWAYARYHDRQLAREQLVVERMRHAAITCWPQDN